MFRVVLLAAWLAAALAATAAGGDETEVVGRVDGQGVTRAELERFIARKYRARPLGKSLLDELRDRLLVAQAVAEHRIATRPEDIDRAYAELDRRVQQETEGAESLDSVLRQKGTSPEEFRIYLGRLVQVRSVIRIERGLDPEAPVPDDDVRRWLEERAGKVAIVRDPDKLAEGVYLEVGGEAIRETQFGREILLGLTRSDCGRELDELLRERVLAWRFAARKLALTGQDLDAAIERERQQYASNPQTRDIPYEEVLKHLGTTAAERRRDPGFRSGAMLLKLARDLFSDEELERYYRDNPDRFGPSVRVRHILIRVAPPDSPFGVGATAEAALARLQAIRSRLVAGDASFEDIARQESEDRSKFTGGELGFLHRADPPGAEFTAAAFALEVGAISAPVRTRHGYHLIQVTEKKPAPPFAEVQGRILRARAADWFREAVNEAGLVNHYAARPPEEDAAGEPGSSDAQRS